MTGKHFYLQPRGTVLNAVSDLAELQKGKFTFSDTGNGTVHFLVTLYHNKWEFRFSVKDTGKNTCCVVLETDGDDERAESLINREYALLDSILRENVRIELAQTHSFSSENIQEGMI